MATATTRLGELRGVDLENDRVDGDLGAREDGPGGRADEALLLGLDLVERDTLRVRARARRGDLADRFLGQADDHLADAARGEK